MSASDKCSTSFTIVASDRWSLSLIFPHGRSHFLKSQSSSIWCAASMSPGRVARLDLNVMKVWWGKTSGYSAGEQQCTPGYQRAMPNRENREKSHRKKPTRPTVTHTQWLLHSSFGKTTSVLSFLVFAFCLDLISRCGFCFFLLWTYLFAEAKYIHIVHLKWTLYVSREDPPRCSVLFSAGLGHTCAISL